jgi:hypothetical protein
VKVDPTPNSLFTQIRPPCSSMNFRQSVSPNPVPSTFLSAVPTWRNSSNTASWSSGAMPTPVSLTDTSTNSFFGTAPTSIRPPSGVNLIAFDSERLDEADLRFSERLDLTAPQREGTDGKAFAKQRHGENRPIVRHRPHARRTDVGILADISNMDDRTVEHRTSGCTLARHRERKDVAPENRQLIRWDAILSVEGDTAARDPV